MGELASDASYHQIILIILSFFDMTIGEHYICMLSIQYFEFKIYSNKYVVLYNKASICHDN